MTRVSVENLMFSLPQVESTRRAPAAHESAAPFEDHLRHAGDQTAIATAHDADQDSANDAPESDSHAAHSETPVANKEKPMSDTSHDSTDTTVAAVAATATVATFAAVDEQQAATPEASDDGLSAEGDSKTVNSRNQPARRTESAVQTPVPRPGNTSPETSTQVQQAAQDATKVTAEGRTAQPTHSSDKSAITQPRTTEVQTNASSTQGTAQPVDESTAAEQSPDVQKPVRAERASRSSRRNDAAGRSPSNAPRDRAFTAAQGALPPAAAAAAASNTAVSNATISEVAPPAAETAAAAQAPTDKVVAADAGTANPRTEANNGPVVAQAGATSKAGTDDAKAHGTSTAKTDSSNPVDRTRFVQRVSRAFQSLGEQGGQLRLRLSPPELGSLRLEVTLRDGVLTARLEAETTAARSVLVENLPQLRERLAEQGMQIERFDVDLMNQSSTGSGEQFADRQRAPRNSTAPSRSIVSNTESTDGNHDRRAVSTTSALDVII